MKKFTLALFVFALPLLLLSQERFETYYNFKGAAGYGTFSSYTFSPFGDLMRYNDNLIFKGYINPKCITCPKHADVSVVTDLTGKFIAATSFKTTDSSTIGVSSQVVTPDGNIVYAGSLFRSRSDGTYTDTLVIFKATTSGIVLWSKSITGRSIRFNFNVIVSSDKQGNIYAYYDGQTDDEEIIGDAEVALKLNKDGQLQWKQALDMGFYDLFEQSKISINSKYVYISGNSYDLLDETGNSARTTICILDKSNGRLIGAKSYSMYKSDGFTLKNYSGNAYIVNDSLYLVGALELDNLYFLLKIKDTTAVPFAQTCQSNDTAIQKSIRKLHSYPLSVVLPGTYTYGLYAYFDENGSMYQVSDYAYGSASAAPGFYLSKTDATGRFCQDTTISPNQPATVTVTVKTREKSIKAINETLTIKNRQITSYNYQVQASIKCSVAAAANIVKQPNALVTTSNKNLQISPNPATNIIWLSFTANKTTNADVNIYNGAGKLLKRKSLSVTNGLNNVSISIKELNAGVYFLKLITDNRVQNIRFVK